MYKIVEDIIKTTVLIKKNYNLLCNLEINNSKDTEEYSKNLNLLVQLLKTESSLYDSIDETLIINVKDLINVSLDYNNLIKQRILNQLDSFKPKFIDCEKVKLQQSLAENSKKHTSIIIIFLQQHIDNEKSEDLKTELIKLKYSILFSNPENKDDLFYESLDEQNEFDKELMNEKLFSNEDKETVPFKTISFIGALNLINVIMSRNDVYYNSCKGKSELISLQCGIRAHFISLDEEMILELNNIFEKIIESKSYINNFESYEIAEQAISDCFIRINEDKKNQYIKK